MIVNGVVHETASPTSVRQVLTDMGITTRGVAVAINGEIVRRSQWDITLVQPSDVVEIVTAVAGG